MMNGGRLVVTRLFQLAYRRFGTGGAAAGERRFGVIGAGARGTGGSRKQSNIIVRTAESKRWLIVVLYAVAMAWVEAAAVYYLRTLEKRIEPYQPNPLPMATGLGEAELIRELATMVMLFTVGWLAGATWRGRLAYSVLAFGIWDIFYYFFLRAMTGWPKSLLDWDILFLIPLPWWGPVWAPTSIALLMILWGTFITQFERFPATLGSISIASAGLGVALALFVFMADALRNADQGTEALRTMLPERFNWPLFSVALALMALPLAAVARQQLRARGKVVS